jgi:ubiquitin carboxyl-terminal hydrolase 48
LGASLQLLTHLAPIRDSVLNAHEPKVDFAELRKAFLAQWIDSQNAAFDPTALMAVMNKRFKYSVKYQEDAQEAMAALLDLLENGIPQIDNLYTARYEETKVCPDCGRTSVSAFPITFINVPLPNVEGRAVSIAECFNLYFSPELLDEFKCDECGRESVRMTKRLLTSPQVLLIHLKRFEYNKDTNVYSRINSYVDVPMELDLATLANGGEGKYKLQGVMHHLGSSLDSGHYVADVRNPEDGKFYHADDSKVGMYTKEPPVSGITPYVLVYLREP